MSATDEVFPCVASSLRYPLASVLGGALRSLPGGHWTRTRRPAAGARRRVPSDAIEAVPEAIGLLQPDKDLAPIGH